MSRILSVASVSSLFVGLGSGLVLAQTVDQSTLWTASPTKITQGTTVTSVILTAPPAVCGGGSGQLNDAYLANTTVKPTVVTQAGLGVSAGAVTHTGNCELTVALTPTAGATPGPLRLTLTASNASTAGTAQPIGIATITVVSSQAGPIPDGLSQQVDADYVVLPYQTAYDNYGTRVANQYFVIVTRIGNNTGYSLQLSGIGFAGSPTGNTSPSIVQGTLLYGEDYSARNMIYRALVSASLLAAGASPFFHATNPKANFAAVVALIGGPLLGSFSQEFPDNTVKQLARLGASDVMTEQNLIPNNSQQSFVAFVGRDTVCPPQAAQHEPVAGFDSSQTLGLCGSGKYQKGRFDPNLVKSKLGAITIVADLLPTFLARIKVTSGTSAGAGTAPAISFSIANQTFGVTPFAVLATSDSPGAITYSVVSGPATISGSTVTITGTGTVVLQASQAASGNYAAATQSSSFTVSSATPSISFAVPNQTYAATPLALSATSNSPGAITYSVVSGPATVSGSTVTMMGIGTVVIQASVAASGNFAAATQIVTFTVQAVAPVITFAVPSQTFPGAPFAVSAAANSGGAITYTVISGPATIAGPMVTLTGTGTVTIQASVASSGNFAAGTQTAAFAVTAAPAPVAPPAAAPPAPPAPAAH